jgi:hypothetical protein
MFRHVVIFRLDPLVLLCLVTSYFYQKDERALSANLQNSITFVVVSIIALPSSRSIYKKPLTLSLLLYIYIYIYLELRVRTEILMSYIYGPTFGNAESRIFLFAAQCFNTESMQKYFLCHSCV